MSDDIDIQGQWPELFAQLGPEQRESAAQALAHAKREGRQVTREDVIEIIDATRGALPPEELTRRNMPPQ